MTVLSPADIARVAAGAGFSGLGLVWAVAVALAESGGNPNAQHVNSDAHRSVDRGLWQINSYWHPEVTDAQAYDPAQAAAAAYRISHRGTNFTGWSTFSNGTAQAKLGKAQTAASAVTATSSTSSTAAGSGGVVAVAEQLLGTPYRYSGTDPQTGLDCSGLTKYCYRVGAGINLPRTSVQQSLAGSPTSSPAPGDLVFFGIPVHHVGIVIGGGRMIHAPRTGEKVQVSTIASQPDASTAKVRTYGAPASAALSVQPASSNWNPLNWPGNVGDYLGGKASDTAGAAAAGVWAQIQPFAVTALFSAAALSLIVVGVALAGKSKVQSDVQTGLQQLPPIVPV